MTFTIRHLGGSLRSLPSAAAVGPQSRPQPSPVTARGLRISFMGAAHLRPARRLSHVVTSRDERFHRDPSADRFEAILERALTAYHRDELHGGAHWIGERILDAELVPIAREAFLDADDLPADGDMLQALDSEPLQFLGEGYHVTALVVPNQRVVVKYAKQLTAVPPLAPPAPASRQEWAQDYGVRPDGSLHPAIWQHIRAFEAYGPLVVPSRVYIADRELDSLSADERRALERFRSIGIVRSLGSDPRPLRGK